MTEQEARELLNEIRSVRPQKRIGRTLYQLRPDGRVDIYTLNKKLTRAAFDCTREAAAAAIYHPDLREWLRSRGALAERT